MTRQSDPQLPLMPVCCPAAGMNFEVMPLIHYPHGFFVFVAITCGFSGCVTLIFRRHGWL